MPAAELVLESDPKWGKSIAALRARFPIPWQVRVYLLAGRTAIASAYIAPNEGEASVKLEAGNEGDSPKRAVEKLIAAADSFGVRSEPIIDLSHMKTALAQGLSRRRRRGVPR